MYVAVTGVILFLVNRGSGLVPKTQTLELICLDSHIDFTDQ